MPSAPPSQNPGNQGPRNRDPRHQDSDSRHHDSRDSRRTQQPQDSSPVSPERFEARTRTRLLVLLCAAGLVLTNPSRRSWGPSPLAAGLVLLVLAVACAVWCFPAMRRAGLSRGAHVAVALLLAAAAYLAIGSGIDLALWQQTSAYRECTKDSVTVSSQAKCQETLYEDLADRLLRN